MQEEPCTRKDIFMPLVCYANVGVDNDGAALVDELRQIAFDRDAELDDDERPYSCNNCGESFSEFAAALAHLKPEATA